MIVNNFTDNEEEKPKKGAEYPVVYLILLATVYITL